MSAFVVSKTHIDLLVAVAVRGPRPERGITPDTVWHTLRWWSKPAREIRGTDLHELQAFRREAVPERASEVGFMLLAENLRSVLHRYDGAEDMRPDWAREPYAWADPGYRLTVTEALKAVDCYCYQACECPDYEDSEAAQFCEALRRALVHSLEGYDGAPWEWTERTSARREAVR